MGKQHIRPVPISIKVNHEKVDQGQANKSEGFTYYYLL